MANLSQAQGKTCPRCGHDLPWSAFYRNKGRKDGHDYMCKGCRNSYAKERRQGPQGDADRLRRRQWRAQPHVRDAENERTRSWKSQNSRHVAEYNAEYFQKNKDHLLSAHKRRVEADPERFRRYAREGYAKHAASRKAKVAEYAQTPRGKACKARSAHKRRARAFDAGELPSIDELIVLKQSSTRCPYCNCLMVGDHLEPNEKTLDHKVPLSRGGTNELSNLECICRRCNTRKSALTDQEYRDRLSGEGA